MVKLYDSGVYLLNGKTLVRESVAQKIRSISENSNNLHS